tara:strand:- start:113 stop:619 length:507 start_codon:yes stop_codon:yes gene_type:complete
MIDLIEKNKHIRKLIDGLEITVNQEFVDWADKKYKVSNYGLGRKGHDYELLEKYLLDCNYVDKKDTDNKWWPDFNIGKMRVDNKWLNSIWFEVKETVEAAVKAGLITHFLFYTTDNKSNDIFKAGDKVVHKFIGFADAKDVLRHKFKGQFSTVVNIDEYFSCNINVTA